MIRDHARSTVFVNAYPSPLGWIWAASLPGGVLRVLMPRPDGREHLHDELHALLGPVRVEKGGPMHPRLRGELEAYFEGSLATFTTPSRTAGTPFQERVWRTVRAIPFGETRTYGEIAAALGIPGGARAIGQANRCNPVPLIVPCHRVTASGGKLGGYASGPDHKRWLLTWERKPSVSPSS